MRLIDADHLKQWIIARWEESPTTPYPLKAVEILKQIEREPIFDADKAIRDAYKHGKSKGIKRGMAMAGRWIPVTERLPERGKDVLVTRDYDGRADHIKSCRYVEVASCYGEDDDVSWNSYSDEYKMTPKNHRVVAWMPLPEPYEEQST